MAEQIPLSQVKPFYHPPESQAEKERKEREEDSPNVRLTISSLSLSQHVEGGYFREIDRHPLRIPNPFSAPNSFSSSPSSSTTTRSASTTIYYLLTPSQPLGTFHRNKARTIHTLHRGRGRYVVVHAGEVETGSDGHITGKARIEVFTVGMNLAKGEKMQWIVEGGDFKASYLLPDVEDGKDGTTDGLLISETVVPGFEMCDHKFMRPETLTQLVTPQQEKELSWLLRKV